MRKFFTDGKLTPEVVSAIMSEEKPNQREKIALRGDKVRSLIPKNIPVMIIFFDWDNRGSSGPQDGQSDRTGIVQKVENGIVYTVEGNSGDSCRVNQYNVGDYEILGYGVPNY